MSLPSCLTKVVRWLRAGYPQGAPAHGYNPLMALMPSTAAEIENKLDEPLPPRQLTDPPPRERLALSLCGNWRSSRIQVEPVTGEYRVVVLAIYQQGFTRATPPSNDGPGADRA